VGNSSEALVKFPELAVGVGGPAPVGRVQPAQRAHTINAGGKSLWFEIGRFQVRFPQTRFSDPLRIVFESNLVFDDLAVAAAESQGTVVKLQGSLAVNHFRVHGREGTEEFYFFLVVVDRPLEETDGAVRDRLGCGQFRENAIPGGTGQWAGSAAGDEPRRVHSLLGESLNNLQPEFPQFDAIARQFRMPCDHPENVARSWV
jgi:hypothetical protein